MGRVLTSLTTVLWCPSCSTGVFRRTCLAKTRNVECRSRVASLALAHMTPMTCREWCLLVSPSTCSTLYSTKSPPFHFTDDDVSTSVNISEAENIFADTSMFVVVVAPWLSCIKHIGNVFFALFGSVRWICSTRKPHILRCWTGLPDQHRQTNRRYRAMRMVRPPENWRALKENEPCLRATPSSPF